MNQPENPDDPLHFVDLPDDANYLGYVIALLPPALLVVLAIMALVVSNVAFGQVPSAEFPADPRIDREQPLLTITAADIAFQGDKLTDGHRQLLARYPDYRMRVYPAHRTAAHPRFDPPFPEPRSGAEAIWNHKLRWRGADVERHDNQFIVHANGAVSRTRILEQVRYSHASSLDSVYSARSTEILSAFARTLSPARIAENTLLVNEKSGAEGRVAWYYDASLRRAYRAPVLQYDTPYPDTDGYQHFDQIDMFSGALDRFDWKLIGRKELYLPYNSNRIAGRSVKYADLIGAKHLNQDLPRYELHRYWVVDATLKPGAHHVYKLRRFYIDEDSWNIEAVDNYDAAGTLVSFQEGHLVHFANAQVTTTAPQVIYDLRGGGYFVTQAFNEDTPPDFAARFPNRYFTPDTLTRVAMK